MKWRKLKACSAVALAISFNAAQAQSIVLPRLGDSSVGSSSSAKSRELGETVLHQIKSVVPVVTDPLWQYYIEHLGKHLLSHSRSPNIKVDFILFNTKVINAFALPGRIIGINSGLVLQSKYEGELASVIAHEIAHVTQNHYERMVDKQARGMFAQIAGMLAAAALATVNPMAATAALTSTLAANHQSMIGYTRDHEYEADWIGVETLKNSNYSESDMANFFNRLPKNSYHANLEALYTHPYPTKRAAEALNRLNTPANSLQRNSGVITELNFQLMKVRLEVETTKNQASLLRKYKNNARKLGVGQVIDSYAIAYCGLKFKDSKKNSLETLRLLNDKYPESIIVIYTFVDALIKQNKLIEASNMINTALSIHLDILPFLILKVNLSQAQKNRIKVKTGLIDIISDYPEYLLAYKQLALNEKEMNNPGISHFFMAKYYYYIGFTDLAVVQLELANQNLHNDLYYGSQVRQLLMRWSGQN
jgi:predicted Zn-dependent protease